MQKLFAVAVAGAASMLYGNEITFTGLDASNPTNLSSSANWSAPPSADVVGVIDLSKTSAAGYVVDGTGLALKGLRIEGAADETITLGGASVLTLGESGYKGNSSLTLRCPVAIAAPQTWDFGEGVAFATYSTISGTADLCISNFMQYVVHYATLGYDGKITYRRSSVSKSNMWVEYCGDGKWASAVHMASEMPLNLRPDNGKSVNWKDVFPVSNPTVASSSANIGLNVSRMPNGGTVVFGDDADLSFATDGTTPYYLTLAGHFRQIGGSIVKRQQYFLTLGHHAQDRSWTYEKPALYSMEGGSLNVSCIMIAFTAQDSSADGNRFVQTGGTVTLPYTDQGANLQIGGGNSMNYTIAEYQMNGGTLNLGGYGGSYNLAIASPRISNTIMPACGFIMKGGTVSSRCLTFGSDKRFWNETLAKMKDAYALLDLSGGTLSFYATYQGGNKDTVTPSWLHFCKAWNCDPANTNCFYSVKLHGGTLNISGEGQADWPLQTCFPKTEVGTVLGNKDRSLMIPAPVYGTGIIRKEGTGGLLLTDATRFTGTLDVRGGVVSVEGATDDIAASDVGCFRWTADSLAATHAENDPVISWTDSNNGVVATTNGNPAVERGAFVAPLFKPDAYNGHAALSFTRSSLAVPILSNPLYGKKSCTVVAVFKTASAGWYQDVAYGSAILSVYPGATHSVFGVGLVSDPERTDDGCRFGVIRRFGGDPDKLVGRSAYASRSGVTLFDGDIHAVAMTLDNDKVTFTVDADYTSTNYIGTADIAPIGYINKNYTDKKRGELLIGGHIVANDSAVDGSAPFKGDLMEIRVYTNRLFSAAEQRQITKKMLQVYDGSATRMAKLESGANATGMGAPGAFSSWTPNEPVAADASWDADTIVAADGAQVSEWTSEDGAKTASVPDGKSTPVLVKNAINGHAALRFSSSAKTALGVSAADSPISGSRSFTAALVWRTETKGESAALGHIYVAPGLISTKQSSSKSADFSLTYRSGSAVMAGYGHSAEDQSFLTRKPYRLNDGEAHISILSCDGEGKTYKLMTDGVFFEGSLANVSERGAFDVMIGAFKAGSSSSSEFFTGDIAAVKLYGSALTKAQMRDLGEYWAKKYATQLLTGYRHSKETIRETGLGATNIVVAADARLSLPLTDQTPFTLAPGARLSGAGSFMGSYRFAAGSVFDLADGVPESFDDLQMYGGSIVFDRANLGNSTLHVRRLKVEGVNTVSIEGAEELPYKTVLFTFDESDVPENANWIVNGAKTTLSSVVIDADAGCATLVTRRGFVLSVR